MRVKHLKQILEQMDDEALVLARNRDMINLEMVDVVGVPKIEGIPGDVRYRQTIDKVYGGDEVELPAGVTQAIIFCDCD